MKYIYKISLFCGFKWLKMVFSTTLVTIKESDSWEIAL
mgnify:CR=1 FL=1